MRAASPACSGFTIVPKFSFSPDASDAAIASACAGRFGVEAEQPAARRRPRRWCRASTCNASRAGSDADSSARPSRAFDLEADDVGVEQRAAGRAGQLGRRQRRRDERRARMRERDEAHVVVVERVRGGAVGERRVRRADARSAVPSTRHGRRRRRPRRRCWTMRAGRLGRAGERHADRVETRAPRRRARAVGRRRRAGHDEVGRGVADGRVDAGSEPSPASRSALPIAAMKRCLMNT